MPRTAALGNYVATLSYRAAGKWRVAATTDLTTAEYRAVEFEASLDADSSVALFSGDTARLRAAAKYLFGMPMDGGTLEWSARIEDRDYWKSNRPPPPPSGPSPTFPPVWRRKSFGPLSGRSTPGELTSRPDRPEPKSSRSSLREIRPAA